MVNANNRVSDNLKRDKRNKRFILSGLLVLGVAFYGISFAMPTQMEIWHNIFDSLGHAFIVAFLLALAGDFYLRSSQNKEAMRQSVEGVINDVFGFLDPRQPLALKEAVFNFARNGLYRKSARWCLEFNWADQKKTVLKLKINAKFDGHNITPEGFLPSRPMWIIDSIPGYQSSYLHYSLQCPSDSINLQLNREELEGYCVHRNGRLFLEQVRIISDKLQGERIGYDSNFNLNNESITYQNPVGHLPIIHPYFVIDFKLELTGKALSDLNIFVFHSTKEDANQDWIPDTSQGDAKSNKWENVYPGKATMIMWAPKGGSRGVFRKLLLSNK